MALAVSPAALAFSTPAKVSVMPSLVLVSSMRNISGCIVEFQPIVFTGVKPGPQPHRLIGGLFIEGKRTFVCRFHPVSRHSDHCRNQMLLVPVENQHDAPVG